MVPDNKVEATRKMCETTLRAFIGLSTDARRSPSHSPPHSFAHSLASSTKAWIITELAGRISRLHTAVSVLQPVEQLLKMTHGGTISQYVLQNSQKLLDELKPIDTGDESQFVGDITKYRDALLLRDVGFWSLRRSPRARRARSSS